MTGRPAIGLVATLAVTMLLAPSATASPRVSKLASNFWWEAEQSPAGLPAPPTVPAGGLWVSSNPTGPQAESAVRFVLADSQTNPVLALRVSSAQPASTVASGVVACPTTSDWSNGPGPGAWNTRPSGDCSIGQVSGVLSPDGHILSFQLSNLAVAGVADIVLEPLGTPTFDATFEPVVAGNVLSSGPPAAVPTTTSPPTVPLTAPAVSVGSLPPPVITAPSVPITPGVAVAAPATTPSLNPSIAPAASSPTTVAAAGVPSSPAAQLVRIPGRSWRDRILLGLAIADIGGYMLWKRPSAGPVPEGGPGRLGKPPPLR